MQVHRFAEELHYDYEKQCSMPVSPASRRDVLIFNIKLWGVIMKGHQKHEKRDYQKEQDHHAS